MPSFEAPAAAAADDELERRREWITFYWSIGSVERAYALGWAGEWERRAGGLVPTLRDEYRDEASQQLVQLPCSSASAPPPSHGSTLQLVAAAPPPADPSSSPRTASFAPGVSGGGVLRDETADGGDAEQASHGWCGGRFRSMLTLCSASVAMLAAVGLVAVTVILFLLSRPRVAITLDDLGSGS